MQTTGTSLAVSKLQKIGAIGVIGVAGVLALLTMASWALSGHLEENQGAN
jgi:hypothetical protein